MTGPFAIFTSIWLGICLLIVIGLYVRAHRTLAEERGKTPLLTFFARGGVGWWNDPFVKVIVYGDAIVVASIVRKYIPFTEIDLEKLLSDRRERELHLCFEGDGYLRYVRLSTAHAQVIKDLIVRARR